MKSLENYSTSHYQTANTYQNSFSNNAVNSCSFSKEDNLILLPSVRITKFQLLKHQISNLKPLSINGKNKYRSINKIEYENKDPYKRSASSTSFQSRVIPKLQKNQQLPMLCQPKQMVCHPESRKISLFHISENKGRSETFNKLRQKLIMNILKNQGFGKINTERSSFQHKLVKTNLAEQGGFNKKAKQINRNLNNGNFYCKDITPSKSVFCKTPSPCKVNINRNSGQLSSVSLIKIPPNNKIGPNKLLNKSDGSISYAKISSEITRKSSECRIKKRPQRYLHEPSLKQLSAVIKEEEEFMEDPRLQDDELNLTILRKCLNIQKDEAIKLVPNLRSCPLVASLQFSQGDIFFLNGIIDK